MSFEIGLLFGVLAVMVVLFLTEKLPVDLTAFAGLVFLVLAGFVAPDEAFDGFSSPAVITMLSIFVISGALLYTGVADAVANRLHDLVGSREIPLVVTLSLLAGLLSAFMNNIAATAVLMPAVTSLAARARLSPSRLFMPLAFGAILGGTTTLVGTPPNILAGDLLAVEGVEGFGLFSFTPLGLILLAVGTLYMITVGRWLLPTRETREEKVPGRSELAALYQVQDKLFTLEIPEGSALVGQQVAETGLAMALGVKVVALERGTGPRSVPRAETVLRAGDRLLLQGRRESVEALSTIEGLEATRARVEELPRPKAGFGGARLRVPEGSSFSGKTFRQLGFRDRFGLVVLAIRREEHLVRENLGDQTLVSGDEIFALGSDDRIGALRNEEELEVVATGFESLRELADQLFLVRVPEDSPLTGRTLTEGRVGERLGLPVAAVLRENRLILTTPSRETTLRPGDRLLVVGPPARLDALQDLGEVKVTAAAPGDLEGRDMALVEASVAPRSHCVGKTLRQLDFRDRYGMVVLSIWRQGEPIQGNLADIPLRLGDALLLQGRPRRIEQLTKDPDFVVLTPLSRPPLRLGRAGFALTGLLLMVALVVSGLQPIHVASFTGATFVLLSGALKMTEAYRVIEWRALFLVAAVLPVGSAMQTTGAADLLATGVIDLARPYGAYGLLAALVVLASLLSQGLDGAPAVVLLTPVVLQTAERLALSPYPLMMGVALAASAAFMTPFSHKANLLVMGAGGYRSYDYLKVGSPLTVVVLALIVVLVPLFFPFSIS